MRYLFVTLFFFSCAQALHEPSPPAAPAEPPIPAITDASRPRVPLDQLAPTEAISGVEATFRLTPDRRLLLSVADVYELSSGHTPPSVEIDFRDGNWRIRCGGAEAGTLPELPTFSDGLDLLTRWSLTLARKAPVANSLPPDVIAAVDRDLEAFDPPNVFSALDRLANASKGARLDTDGWARSAHGATLLAVKIFDQFELGDPLRARALALLAMARAANAQCCSDDVALLASLFGYQSEAGKFAAPLPATSFAKAFINGLPADGKLPSESATRWLRVGQALPQASLTGRNAFQGSLNVQAAPLLMEVSSFGDQEAIGRAVQEIVLGEVETNRFNTGELLFSGSGDWLQENAGRIPNLQRGATVERFEKALPARLSALQNRILDRPSVRAYYESTFYAAVFKEFAFHQYRRASRESAHQFIAALGKPASGTGSEVIAWMSDLVRATFEAASGMGQPSETLERLTRIGAWQKAQLLQRIAEAIGGYQPSIRVAAYQLYKQLDSRPAQLFKAGMISMRVIADPMRRDRYVTTALQRAPRVGTYGDVAEYRFEAGDRAGLRALVDDRGASASDRAAALNYLRRVGNADAPFVHRRFEEMINESPDIPILSGYATYLNERGEPTIKERVMRNVLQKWNGHVEPIATAWVAASLANALERQGRYKEGLEVIAPYLEVGSANVMSYTASLLQRVARVQEANNLGEALVKRYPDAAARADFAAILWRERRYADAAHLFDPHSASYSASEAAYSLPAAFVETFGQANIREAVDAFNALIAADLDAQLLRTIPKHALDEKKPEVALAMAERLVANVSKTHAPAGLDTPAVLAGYRALQQTKGSDAALAWLQAQIPPGAAMQALVDFYAQGEYDLMQRYASVVPEQKSPESAALQAASLLAMRVPPSDARWQTLLATIRTLPDQPNSLPLAKYLAGIVEEPAVFAAAKNREAHANAEYFAGVKALANNEYDRALSLMLAASFGPANYAPQVWAMWRLDHWSQQHETWDEIVKQHH